MNSDEQAIRKLVDAWLDASKRGDLAAVLSLMDDDVVFMVPGQEPFGKEGWSERMKDLSVEGASDIQEIKVSGEWAWMRQHLRVTNHAAERQAQRAIGSHDGNSTQEAERKMGSGARCESVDARNRNRPNLKFAS